MRTTPLPPVVPRRGAALVPVLALLAAAALGAAAACRPAAGDARADAGAAKGAANGAAGASAGGGAAPGRMPADSLALRAAADTGRILGSPSARVWVLVASDFQCPYCKVWHDASYAELQRDYVATGKVRMAFMNFPLDQHAQAIPAAEAAMCAAAQGRFWPYHTALFETQDRWGQGGDQRPVYAELAARVGVDTARWGACVDSHVMRALVEADRDRMTRAGVQSTPSFFVGRTQLAGALPTPVFRQAIDSALAAGAPAAR